MVVKLLFGLTLRLIQWEANSDLHLKPFTAPVADLTPHVLTTSQLAKRLGCHERTVRRHALFTITNKPDYYSLSTDPILLVLREAGGQVLQGADHERYCILKHEKKVDLLKKILAMIGYL